MPSSTAKRSATTKRTAAAQAVPSGRDHATGVVAGVVVRADTEIADGDCPTIRQGVVGSVSTSIRQVVNAKM